MLDFIDLEFIKTEIINNEFFRGGFIIGLIAFVGRYALSIPRKIKDLIRNHFLITLSVHDNDKSFEWLEAWMCRKYPHKFKKRSYLRAMRKLSISEEFPTGYNLSYGSGNDDKDTKLISVPGIGWYWLFHRRRLFIVHKSNISETPITSGGRSNYEFPTQWEIYCLTWNRSIVNTFLNDIWTMSHPIEDEVISNYYFNKYEWKELPPIFKRPIASVILNDNILDKLVSNLRQFLGLREWYRSMGIPFRRGILLHGHPGNGKTSMIQAVASSLDLSIYTLNINQPVEFTSLKDSLRETQLLVIEDVDCFFEGRDKKSKNDDALTFPMLLDIVDGLNSTKGMIVIMTTNHIDKIDPALIRSGRCDMRIEVGSPTEDQIRRMAERFGYDGDIPPVTNMADLQEFLIGQYIKGI